jgi:hypothetical protein
MKRKKWQVWSGDDCDNVIYTGNRQKCLAFYYRKGGAAAGLHLGYEL